MSESQQTDAIAPTGPLRVVIACVVSLWMVMGAVAHAAGGGGPSGSSVAVRVTVTPANDSLAEQLRDWAGQPSGERDRDRRFWVRELPERLRLALQSEGWYDPDIEVSDAATGVDIRVSSAVPISLREVAVSIPGGHTLAPGLVAWLEEATPALDQQLKHARYESLREGLLNQAISLGFLDAQFTRQRLLVSVRERAATIDLSLALGEPYKVGEITFEQSPIRPDIVRNLAPFKPGDRYTADALAEYARRLRDASFFASARVVPVFDQIEAGTVPLRVMLEPRKPNRLRFGLGYATDVGFRVLAGWDRYLIDERGHSLALDTELSAYRRSANLEYRVPESKRPATRTWLLSAGSLRETIDSTATTQQNARVARERRHGNGLVDTTYLRYQRDRGLPDDSSVKFQAFMVGAELQHVSSLAVAPERLLELGSTLQWLGAHENVGADFSFTRAYARLSARLPINSQHSLRGRLEWGQLWRADIRNMPMSLRFFAGGDGSIRGFGPREASPQDSDGNVTGGDEMLVNSLEYEYRLRPAWGLAAFVDRGRAWVSESEAVRTGAGVGLRWYSPVGPVNLDVARPVANANGDGDWRIHLTIGL